ncbi:MAG: histone H1 [Cytophagales bacterium]|nr:histone H1 [Cytophagales bacterium]
MSKLFKKVKGIVNGIEDDVSKFYEGKNKTAGTRVRKAFQEVKVLSQEIRKEVQEIKNSDK